MYGLPRADLPVLDSALKHRAVAVATDEALCIATLMSLDVSDIISFPENQRMCKVWKLLVRSQTGVPAGIVLFSEPRLKVPGFRWAPASTLGFAKSDVSRLGRAANWQSPRSEAVTPFGLQVRFPGFYLRPPSYDDNLPRDPFMGSLRRKNGKIGRLYEDFIYFQTPDKELFSFCKREADGNVRIDTGEDGREWKIDMTNPLYEMALSGRCALLLRKYPSSEGDPPRSESGLIVKILEKEKVRRSCEALKVDRFSLDDGTGEEEKGLRVRAEGLIHAGRVKSSEILVIRTIERLAAQLRKHALTRKLCEIADVESREYREVMEELKEQMRKLMKEAQDADQDLVDAIDYNWSNFRDDIWKRIANWYRQEIFVAERLEEDQVWFVD